MDYKRVQQRATFRGVNLNCQPDQCSADQLLVGTNVRNVGSALTMRESMAAFQTTGSESRFTASRRFKRRVSRGASPARAHRSTWTALRWTPGTRVTR